MNQLARMIRSARLAKKAAGPGRSHFSIADLAKRCGVQKGNMGSYEAGRLLPMPETCVKIAAALELDEDRVLMAAGYLPEDVLLFMLKRPDVVRLVRRIKKERWPKQVVEDHGR